MKIVKRAEIVTTMAEDAGISLKGAQAAFESLTRNITHSLKNADRVTLIGWGTFSFVKKGARMGRNPRTGAPIRVSAKNVVKFKAGKDLREAIN